MDKIILAVLCLLIALSGCQNPRTPSNAQQVMRLCFHFDPTTLDTRKNSELYSSSLQFMLYEGLTRLLADGQIELALAEKVHVSADGLTYRFHLRKAQWSDGHPITAHDFEYSWKKVLTPNFGSPGPHLFYCIQNAEEAVKGKVSPDEVAVHALEERVLEVRLKNPTPYFLSLVSFCNFYPIPKHVEEADPNWHTCTDQRLVCSGPFKLVKWIHNQEILTTKNLHYWDQENVHLDAIHVSIVGDEKTSLNMFQNGDLDLLNSLTTPLSTDDLIPLRKEGKVQLRPIGGTVFCTFNLKNPFLENKHLRHALSLAINRLSIIENITQLSEAPASRYIPPVIVQNANRSLIPLTAFSDAREHFKKGLLELGIDPEMPDHQSHPKYQEMVHCLSLTYENVELNRRIALAIQDQWKEVLGLSVPLKGLDMKSQLSSLEERSYSIALDFWLVQYPDPIGILERFKHQQAKKNFPGYNNPKYTDFLDQAAATNDTTLRMQYLEQAESLIIADMPLTPLFHFNQAVLSSNRFTDIEFSPIGNLIYKKIQPTTVPKP